MSPVVSAVGKRKRQRFETSVLFDVTARDPDAQASVLDQFTNCASDVVGLGQDLVLE
jgi:hypothetical protein